jgi:monoamine oxidase
MPWSPGEWNAYVRAIAGFMSRAARAHLRQRLLGLRRYLDGPELEPAARLLHAGRRQPAFLGRATARHARRADRPDGGRRRRTTRAETVRTGAAILTVSTAVLAGAAIRLPAGVDPWREAAAALPLGRNEKVFLEIGRDAAFESDSHAYGNLRDARSASYSIWPNGWPVIEAFLGGDGARILEEEGPAAGFAYVSAELAALFGTDVASAIRPLAATS